MVLNGVPVIRNLDIFARVGKAVAHDEVVAFSLQDEELVVGEEATPFDGTLSIQFAKVRRRECVCVCVERERVCVFVWVCVL